MLRAAVLKPHPTLSQGASVNLPEDHRICQTSEENMVILNIWKTPHKLLAWSSSQLQHWIALLFDDIKLWEASFFTVAATKDKSYEKVNVEQRKSWGYPIQFQGLRRAVPNRYTHPITKWLQLFKSEIFFFQFMHNKICKWLLNVGGQFSTELSCFCICCKQRHWLPLSQTIFSRMFG